MDKYEELYNLAKEAFKEELERFYTVERKAAQYLSVLTLLLGAAAFFLKWLSDNFIPPQNGFEFALLILAVVTVGSMVVAWLAILLTLKNYKMGALTLNNEWIEFFRANTLLNIYFNVSIKLAAEKDKNRVIVNRKARRLNFAYSSMILAIICLLLFTTLFVAYRWRQPRTQNTGGVQNAGSK